MTIFQLLLFIDVTTIFMGDTMKKSMIKLSGGTGGRINFILKKMRCRN